MIYLWRIADDYPQVLIGEYQREGTPDRLIFKKGESLTEVIGLPVIKFDAPIERIKKFDCLTSNAMVPLVNNTFAAILRELAPSDIQLVKAHVVGSDGATEEFSLLNVTRKVVGIDRDNSEFNYVPSTQNIMSFRKLAYVEGCLGEHKLARDSEYLSHLLVSEIVAKRLKDEKLMGIALVKPSEIVW